MCRIDAPKEDEDSELNGPRPPSYPEVITQGATLSSGTDTGTSGSENSGDPETLLAALTLETSNDEIGDDSYRQG